ncbi:ComF family protein [Elusimicrobiota bacterium]
MNMLFPVSCSVCNGDIRYNNRFGVCKGCLESLEIVNSYACRYCGRPVDNMREFCRFCFDKRTLIKSIYTACYYKGNAKKLIKDFKYSNKRYLGKLLSKLLVKLYKTSFKEKASLVVPIPLHKHKKRDRGYNQAEVLGKYFSAEAKLKFNNKLLVRKKQTNPQYDLTRSERFKNVENAFESSGEIKNKNIILIDDVATTGATLQNAAGALNDAGAGSIFALIVAHGQ